MKQPGSQLAELYRRWGRCVFEAHGVYFTNVDPGSRMFAPVLDHGNFDFTREECEQVLREGRGLVLRYPSSAQAGLAGGAYVCTDRAYDYPQLTKRMRNYVRRGQDACEIRALFREELIAHGLRLNQETDERHGRRRAEFCDAQRWTATAAAAFESPGAFVMGAWVDGQLASYQIGMLEGDWAYALIQMSRTDLLEHHPNHALDFAFNRWAFRQPGVSGVCIGPVPLRHNEGLHNYKIRMGFEARPMNTAIRLHPALAMTAGHRGAEWLIGAARRFAPLRDPLEGLEIAIRGSRITAQEEVILPFSNVAEQKRETI